MSILSPGLNRGVSNADYHADKVYLSSSKLKQLLLDPQAFYQEVVLGKVMLEEKAFFDVGSLTHTLILEPEMAEIEYAVYPGAARRGAEYEKFAAANPGKKIMTKAQAEAAQSYAAASRQRPEFMALLTGGEAELSICGIINDVPVKMRADYINIEKGYILDVKTTRDAPGAMFFRHAIKDFGYDVSAALYCLIAEQHFNKPFDFYWGVISKEQPPAADVYGIKPETRLAADAEIYRALELLKTCQATGVWELPAEAGATASSGYEIERL